jgi:hypothetical protein
VRRTSTVLDNLGVLLARTVAVLCVAEAAVVNVRGSGVCSWIVREQQRFDTGLAGSRCARLDAGRVGGNAIVGRACVSI